MSSRSIKVFDVRDNDRLALHVEAGRMGFAESADLDFLKFASGAIGAAYVIVNDAAKRLSEIGASVIIVDANGERVFAAEV